MASAEAAASRGDAFRAEGEKALGRSTIFGFGKTKKFEDAAEAFTKAGNAYKLATRWQEAGEMFLKASTAHKELGSDSDTVNSIVEAGNCFKKVNPVECIKAFTSAIELYNLSGRFGMSARYWKEVAEIYEADGNTAGAIESYEQAATLFSGDNKQTTANQCLVKIGTLAGQEDQFTRAADIFEQIGRESLTSNLGKYSAKGYFLQSLLCHLAAGDNVAVKGKLEEYKNADFSFPGSRECGFVEKLIQVGFIYMAFLGCLFSVLMRRLTASTRCKEKYQ